MDDKKSLTLREHFKVCFGIILIALSIITLTGKTAIGEFFAYSFAFLFGSFFPFFAVLFLLLGLFFIIRRKGLPVKNHLLVYLGVFFLLLSTLAFGSLTISKENPNLNFSTLLDFYQRRMKTFAQIPFMVDTYDTLSTLGGGYFGFFFYTLLKSVWGDIGNAVFFSILLLLGLFFALYAPISSLVSKWKKKKTNKVQYTSPHHPEKGIEKEVFHRQERKPVETPTIDPALKEPLSPDWQKTTGTMTTQSVLDMTLDSSFAPLDKPVEKKEEKVEEKKVEILPEKKSEPSIFEDKLLNDNNLPMHEKSILATPQLDDYDLSLSANKKEPVKEETKPVKEENPFDTIQPIVPTIPLQNEVKHEEVKKAPITEEVRPSYPSINPLEAVKKNVQPKANKEETVTVAVEEEKVPSQAIPEPVLDEEPAMMKTKEESEKDIEKRYFYDKQRKAIQAIEDKQRERNERKAALMRFVSDTPKIYCYALPTDALLQEHDDSAKMLINKEAADKKVKVINEVFKDYDVKAKAVSYTVGASVTRFNIETEPGERSDRIASLVDELQRSLNGDKSVRVETVVEGRNTSGIEVGNAKPMAVSFKDVFEAVELNTKDNLLLPIGKDISGNIVTCPLNKMPHILIAGTTGSGKSVLVHSMITTLIMRNYPSQMKLILIDPKQVEFIRYQECSHLFCPVISKPEKAVLALKKLVDEMERRFTVFTKYKVANIEGYYKARQGKEAVMEDMPYLVCVIDEFADLMMTGGKDVVNYVQRIGQKARAAGIHMIIATQRPSKETVPMMIKANVPCRIGLSCSAQVDSRVILDENGAETLLGRGDLLFKDPGRKSLIRAQSPYLSDEEIDSILAYVKERAGDPVYDKAFLELEDVDDDAELDEDVDPQKRLYDDIKDFIIHTGITSKESIMRNFQVSSSKADNYLAALVSEKVLMLGYEGTYILGPQALQILSKEKEGL